MARASSWGGVYQDVWSIRFPRLCAMFNIVFRAYMHVFGSVNKRQIAEIVAHAHVNECVRD